MFFICNMIIAVFFLFYSYGHFLERFRSVLPHSCFLYYVVLISGLMVFSNLHLSEAKNKESIFRKVFCLNSQKQQFYMSKASFTQCHLPYCCSKGFSMRQYSNLPTDTGELLMILFFLRNTIQKFVKQQFLVFS